MRRTPRTAFLLRREDGSTQDLCVQPRIHALVRVDITGPNGEREVTHSTDKFCEHADVANISRGHFPLGSVGDGPHSSLKRIERVAVTFLAAEISVAAALTLLAVADPLWAMQSGAPFVNIYVEASVTVCEESNLVGVESNGRDRTRLRQVDYQRQLDINRTLIFSAEGN